MTNPNIPSGAENGAEAAMKKPDVPTQRVKTLEEMRALLSGEAIEDPVDRQIVADACAFLESPVDDAMAINVHCANVCAVIGGYDMQGTDAPEEIENVNKQLLNLLCRHYIDAITRELAKDAPDLTELKRLKRLALEAAVVIQKGQKDDSFLTEIQAFAIA